MTGNEAEWLKKFLANIPLEMKPMSYVSMHCDFQLVIAITKTNTYNAKNN